MDKDSFDSIYRDNHNKIYRLCLGYFGGNNQIAKDACQEVFIKVWQNIDRFKGQSKVSTWIYRITVNTCINILRKSKNNLKTLPLFEEIKASEDDIKTDDKLKTMYRCIYELKPKDRTIILLVLDQEPYEDIANIIGISENNLRVRIHRIKDKLSKCVKL